MPVRCSATVRRLRTHLAKSTEACTTLIIRKAARWTRRAIDTVGTVGSEWTRLAPYIGGDSLEGSLLALTAIPRRARRRRDQIDAMSIVCVRRHVFLLESKRADAVVEGGVFGGRVAARDCEDDRLACGLPVDVCLHTHIAQGDDLWYHLKFH